MIRERHFVLTSQAGRRLVGRLGPPDINQDHDDDPAGRTPTKFMRIAARRAVGLAARSAVNVERCLRETDDGGVVIVLSTSVLGSSVYLILWFFLIYSIVGVIVEMLFCLVVDGVLESRTGLLYVPLRPIYGVGGVACELLLHLTREPILLFLSGMLVGSAVEYGAGLFVEKAFGTASWDYSEKRCNVHGRICLQYSVAWGLLALLVAYRLDPLFSWVVGVPDRQLGETLLTVLMLVTLLAGGLTAAALTRMRERVAGLRARVSGQSVPVITTAWDRLIDRLVPEPVIINSFPRASLTTEFMELTGTQRRWIRIPAWPERQLIGRETRRLTRRDVALASAITNAEPGFNRIIKQTERVGCGFRNMIDYQRRILTRIAVTPTTMVSSMNEAVPAQTRRAALPELGTPTKSDQSTAGTSLEPRRSRRREDRGSTVRLVDDEFSRRPGVQ